MGGDGSFSIKRPQFNGKWPNYDATFSVAQNKRDEALLNRIIKTLGCGNIKSDLNDMRSLSVRNKKDLFNIIIPFFTQYDINTNKSQDFYYFVIAMSILYNNLGKGFKNLTQDNINKLEHCINSMNKNRYKSKIDE